MWQKKKLLLSQIVQKSLTANGKIPLHNVAKRIEMRQFFCVPQKVFGVTN